jgi:hypothetical protein
VRLYNFVDQAMSSTLASDWYRDSVQMAVPDVENGPNAFKGKSGGFSGLTLAPVRGTPGAPTAFAWQIARGSNGTTRLQYSEAGSPWSDIAVWVGEGGQFKYADKPGEWSEEWPLPLARAVPLGTIRTLVQPQVPRFVLFEPGPGADRWASIVTILPLREALQRNTNVLNQAMRP